MNLWDDGHACGHELRVTQQKYDVRKLPTISESKMSASFIMITNENVGIHNKMYLG